MFALFNDEIFKGTIDFDEFLIKLRVSVHFLANLKIPETYYA
jgi:hypothetical protein